MGARADVPGFLPRTPNAKRAGVPVYTVSNLVNVRLDSNRCLDHVGVGTRSTPQMAIANLRTDCVVRRNYVGPTAMSRGMEFGSNSNLLIEQNHIDRVSGSNIAFTGGGHAANTTIRDNLLVGTADIHGNGLTLYAHFYGGRVTGNVSRGSARPLTTQASSNDYDEATYGAAYIYFDDNTFVIDPALTAPQYAFWANGSGVKNILLCGGFAGSNHPSGSSGSIALSSGGLSVSTFYSENTTFVGFVYGAAGDMVKAVPSNTCYEKTDPASAGLIAAAMAAVPALPVGPA